ncbi:MAG: S24/S26 family peptidase [Elusimicrobiota bacterium]
MSNGVSAFRLEGSSMLPVFKPGEIILIQPLIPQPSALILSPGDCAVYSYGGRELLHRVVRTGPDGAWFADDAGRLEPHLTPWENVRGKVLSRNLLADGLCGRFYSKIRRIVNAAFRQT